MFLFLVLIISFVQPKNMRFHGVIFTRGAISEPQEEVSDHLYQTTTSSAENVEHKQNPEPLVSKDPKTTTDKVIIPDFQAQQQSTIEFRGKIPKPNKIKKFNFQIIKPVEEPINLNEVSVQWIIKKIQTRKKIKTSSFSFTKMIPVICTNCEKKFNEIAESFSLIDNISKTAGISMHCKQTKPINHEINKSKLCSLAVFDKVKECKIDTEQSMLITYEIINLGDVDGSIFIYTSKVPCMICLTIENEFLKSHPKLTIRHFYKDKTYRDLTKILTNLCFKGHSLFDQSKDNYLDEYIQYIDGQKPINQNYKLIQIFN